MQREDAIEDAWMRIDPDPGDGIIQWPEFYHNRSANFSFADGHAEGHQWQDPRTTPSLRKGRRLAEWGFPLGNNPDARWIRERATSQARQ
jgi:prepilin-type processing-associated H-X9-DG protein